MVGRLGASGCLVCGRLRSTGGLVVGLPCSRRDSVSSVFGCILGVGSGGLHILLGAILRNGKAGGEKDGESRR